MLLSVLNLNYFFFCFFQKVYLKLFYVSIGHRMIYARYLGNFYVKTWCDRKSVMENNLGHM